MKISVPTPVKLKDKGFSYLAILLLTPSKVERKFVLNYTYTASWNEFK